MGNMLKTVRRTIKRFSMLSAGDHVLVAVSGGPDSVALLRILTILAPEYGLRLTIAHLNHGLRGDEADSDETFVRRQAEEMGLPFISRQVDIRALQKGSGRSLEEIGRRERYRFLEEALHSCGADKIATGHHRDDQAETVLLNLIRGSGLEGLKGIPPLRDRRIIRPLLFVSKNDIHEFLLQKGFPFILDSSNEMPCFLRNKIRQQLLPELVSHFNPRMAIGLSRTAEVIRRDDDYLQSVVRGILRKWEVAVSLSEVHLPLAEFMDLHGALRARIIKYLLESYAPLGAAIGYQHVESVLNLCHSDRHGRVSLDLPGGISVEKRTEILLIQKAPTGFRRQSGRKDRGKKAGYSYPIEIPGVIHLSGIGRSIHFDFVNKPDFESIKQSPDIAYLDYERMCPPLQLRNCQPGDRIEPLGMTGKKKLHDYFIDRKIPLPLRAEIPLIVDALSVVWIAGQTVSERVKIDGETKKVLKAEMV